MDQNNKARNNVKSNTSNWDLSNQVEKIDRKVIDQILYDILEGLLAQAFYSLLQNTQIMKRCLSQLVVYSIMDKRRNVSQDSKISINASVLRHLAFNTELNVNTIDRRKVYEMTNYVLDRMAIIEKIEILAIKHPKHIIAKRNLALAIGCPEHLLSPLYKWSNSFMQEYEKFRDSIISRYLKLCYHIANRQYFRQSKRIDPSELYKNLLLSTLKAVEKCNPLKGRLTSFVQKHFKNAIHYPEFNHYYGIAYQIPNGVKVPISNSTETVNLEEVVDPTTEDFHSMINNKMAQYLKQVRGAELAFIMMEIPFNMKPNEISMLRGKTVTSKQLVQSSTGD